MAVSRSVAALCGAAGVALVSLSGTALAEEFAWSATLTGTSDYVFRGISQTDNDPTIQGSLGATYGMFYVGIWGSGLDWDNLLGDPEAEIELDYYAGITPTWGPVSFDLGFIYYDYPGAQGDPDILELKAGAKGEIYKDLTAGVTYFYSPDYNDLEYGVIEGTLAYALPTVHVFSPSISGVVGYFDDYNTDAEYTYWNAGLTLAVEKLSFDFRYWDTDISTATCGGDFCDERFVFSATVALP